MKISGQYSLYKYMFLIVVLILSKTMMGQENKTSIELEVIVTDFENNIQQGEQIIFEGIKSKKIIKGVTDNNGKLKVFLPGGDTYLIQIKSVGDVQDYNKIEVPVVEEGYTYSTMQLEIKFELPKTFTLDNVHFDFGRSSLRPASYKELNELIELMKLKKNLKIEIAGHTDNVGSPESNLKLSQNRAISVRNYLIKRGITSQRVIAKGYGETQPIADNSTDQGRQKNRRTEVRILEK